MREELIEVIKKTPGLAASRRAPGIIADNILASGIMVQKWIPVQERMPELRMEKCETDGDDELSYEVSDYVLGVDENKMVWRVMYETGPVFQGWIDEQGSTYHITHWMPLPEPPKEETCPTE